MTKPHEKGPYMPVDLAPSDIGGVVIGHDKQPHAIHRLKVVQPYFDALISGAKRFELRRDDRGFQPGDLLDLREWTGEDYTGRRIFREITYVLRDAEDFGLMPGFVVIGLSDARF